jgi:hypothetical protein
MERNHKKYRPFIIENFEKFLNGGITWKTLHDNLHKIQDELGFNRQRGMKALWFKFHKDDNFNPTINQIISKLRFCDENDKTYMIEQINFVINNPKELMIFYS